MCIGTFWCAVATRIRFLQCDNFTVEGHKYDKGRDGVVVVDGLPCALCFNCVTHLALMSKAPRAQDIKFVRAHYPAHCSLAPRCQVAISAYKVIIAS